MRPDQVRSAPVIVVGSGVAGLTVALGLEGAVVITKSRLGDGSSRWAQGGIAAALGASDDVADHAADTVRVGGGIADEAVARLVTGSAPDRIQWLLDLGARFDRTRRGDYQLGREAGHSARRIVHANGDATGAELMRTLTTAVALRPDIEVVEEALAVELIRLDGAVAGVVTVDAGGARTEWYGAVVLATGGIGRLYARTTNPIEVTGDGLAMAIRAGAAVSDLEFVQFHPTALAGALDPMPLLTEALRGEGAHLIDETGARYMVDIHPDAELAPRDVVARAGWHHLANGHEIYLDATRFGSGFRDRFPTVWGFASAAGFDPSKEPLPVSPAAHYHMGGVVVDMWGRASLPGLWACGEVARTGLHGANRLASNSLLEGLVFGGRVAAAIRTDPSVNGVGGDTGGFAEFEARVDTETTTIVAVRRLMWERVGVVRDHGGLESALADLEDLAVGVDSFEERTAVTVAHSVTTAALARRESRGGHYRSDYPTAELVIAAERGAA